MSEETDSLLVALAQRSGGIQPLLDSVFSFLKRKTDFYHIQNPGDRIGFPEGVAEQLVLQAFRKFGSNPSAKGPSKEDLEGRGERIGTGHAKDKTSKLSKAAKPTAQKQSPPAARSPDTDTPQPSASVPQSSSTQSPTPASTPPISETSTEASPAVLDRSEVPKPVESESSKQAAVKQAGNFVTYNGAACEKYKWSQTIDDVTFFIDVSPSGAQVKGKDVECNIQKKKLKIVLKTDKANPVLEGDLFGEVKHEEAVWSVEDKRFLSITLEKWKKIWWKSALVGDPEIDTQKVDSTCAVDDYDESTQAAIRKVMFDQHQKRQGLPTSDELNQRELLRKAWDAEGSPFKGTPFDPSAVNIQDSGPMGGAGLPPFP